MWQRADREPNRAVCPVAEKFGLQQYYAKKRPHPEILVDVAQSAIRALIVVCGASAPAMDEKTMIE
jgi:hypothetical protein